MQIQVSSLVCSRTSSPQHRKSAETSLSTCGRRRCPELANNNQGVALCDTPSLGLDNEQAPDSRFADEESCPVHIED
ncbi:E3 ubiquitin ligase RNF157 isoform X3 [Lates japonicus]|uniref:E3 ubiquitin ligase RNF157 isoform X3 n=1 Tax=Lates japonicus TaxID=270547 RepID=A0AAD3NKA5_LATJO|nr:E3 ubiquitin ligase RNF157 isoform X3 [Lates japonicus]